MGRRFLRSCMRRDRVKREVGMADMWTAKETKPVLVVYARRRQARPPFTHPTRKTMTAAAAATKLGLFQNNYAFFYARSPTSPPILLSQYCRIVRFAYDRFLSVKNSGSRRMRDLLGELT